MVKLILKVTKINKNKYLLLNKTDRKRLADELDISLTSGEFLDVNILGLNLMGKAKSYFCKKCGFNFYSESHKPFCPNCGENVILKPANVVKTTIKPEIKLKKPKKKLNNNIIKEEPTNGEI